VNHGRILFHMVRADFLERVRRYSYLVTLAATLFLAYHVATGQLRITLDGYRGVYNSAWIGAVMTLVTVTFLCLAGFYVVKNGVFRDQQTRVGQILAATPLSKPMYTVGKMRSNFLVLTSMVALLALAGVAMQLFMGEDRSVDVLKIAVPLIAVALPAMAVVAGLAILFETLPLLRGGVGNVAAFFLYLYGLAASVRGPVFDVLGLEIFARQLGDAVRSVSPNYKAGLNIGNDGRPIKGTFVFDGFDVTSEVLWTRLVVIGSGIALALLASVFFHRFDPAKRGNVGAGLFARLRGAFRRTQVAKENLREEVETPHVHLTPIRAISGKFSFGEMRFVQMYRAELALMFKGRSRWWYLVGAGLFITTIANPLPGALQMLSVVWLWPMFIWSKLGTRDSICNTEKLLFSAPHANLRQLPATYTAAVTVALAFASAALAKLLIARDGRGIFVVVVGAMLIPAFALACGTLTKTNKLFEALYIVFWYTGPVQTGGPLLDYTGSNATVRASYQPEQLLLAAIVCLAITFAARQKAWWERLVSPQLPATSSSTP
jgi:hypothetical protein